MIQYKWVALSNTTIGILMASINGTIILISIPAIFNGIHINFLQSDSLVYLLWLLMGYNIVTTTLLVSFGRLSDIYGRIKLFNLGFMIFTIGSILLSLTYGTGDQAALELIIFRLLQGVGAAFLFSNSSAIITDAFPVEERGMALGLNMVAALAGSFIGLVLGGILSVFDWRYVFLVSVPVGAIGTIWSYWKMKETGIKQKDEKIDYFGNATFGIGLTLLLIGVTYGLLPYGTSMYGWLNPWVDFSLLTGTFLLVLFPFVELRVKNPMFRMELFKIRAFAAGNFASLLASLGRGGVMLMLIILLQGIWLPLHGYTISIN
ncbi:multidrug resistance protein, partial [mine drainage metagenome]